MSEAAADGDVVPISERRLRRGMAAGCTDAIRSLTGTGVALSCDGSGASQGSTESSLDPILSPGLTQPNPSPDPLRVQGGSVPGATELLAR